MQLDDASSDQPAPGADDLFVYFSSPRKGPGAIGGDDIWLARRASSGSPFGATSNVTELNTPANDRPSWVSADGCRLYFDSDRTGTWDLFVARRSP